MTFIKVFKRAGFAALILGIAGTAAVAQNVGAGKTPGAKFSGSAWGNVPNVGDRNVAPSGPRIGGGGGGGGGFVKPGGGGGRPGGNWNNGGGYSGGGIKHGGGGKHHYGNHRPRRFYSYGVPAYYYDDSYSSYAYSASDDECGYLWRRYLNTGNPKWKRRYYNCID